MKNKQYNISREELELNHIKEIYNQMTADGKDKTLRQKLVNQLLSMQKPDGSWAVIETRKCDSDIRVYYIYFPTYYATATLMYADIYENYSDTSKEKVALLNGLKVACERNLMGHGFDATRQMLDTLGIYKNAGLYNWMKKSQNPFCDVICERISFMSSCLENNDTFSDWNVDFKEEYQQEVSDFNEYDNKYIWYACYGSNINKDRFMEYINSCNDKTPPVEDRPFVFNHNIYFAKKSQKWNGAKAFLDDMCDGKAYGRIYKITKSQFEQILRAEGTDYTKELQLGKVQGIDVYSFTDAQKNDVTLPSDEYYKTILNGLYDCYEGILESEELNKYLIDKIFPENTFEVAKAIKKSPHYMSNADIATTTGICGKDLEIAISWLCDHNVIKQDSRSIRSGHRCTDTQAYFYTMDTCCARGLLEVILHTF